MCGVLLSCLVSMICMWYVLSLFCLCGLFLGAWWRVSVCCVCLCVFSVLLVYEAIWNYKQGSSKNTLPYTPMGCCLIPTNLVGNAYFSIRCRIKNPYFFDIFPILSIFYQLISSPLLFILYL